MDAIRLVGLSHADETGYGFGPHPQTSNSDDKPGDFHPHPTFCANFSARMDGRRGTQVPRCFPRVRDCIWPGVRGRGGRVAGAGRLWVSRQGVTARERFTEERQGRLGLTDVPSSSASELCTKRGSARA